MSSNWLIDLLHNHQNVSFLFCFFLNIYILFSFLFFLVLFFFCKSVTESAALLEPQQQMVNLDFPSSHMAQERINNYTVLIRGTSVTNLTIAQWLSFRPDIDNNFYGA